MDLMNILIEIPEDLRLHIIVLLLTDSNTPLLSYLDILRALRNLTPVPVIMMAFHCIMLDIGKKIKNLALQIIIPIHVLKWLVQHEPRIYSILFDKKRIQSFHSFYVQYSETLALMGIPRYSKRHINLVTRRAVLYAERNADVYWNGSYHAPFLINDN